jgi:hypothetical protein
MQQNEEKVKQNIVTDNVSMFENAMKTVPVASRTAKEILDGIKNGLWAGSVRAARAAVNDPEEYSRRKKRLSAVAFAGTFSKRNAQGLASASGYIVADLDHMYDDDIIRIQEKAKSDQYVWFCFRSPSNQGLKLGLRNFDSVDYKDFFLAAQNYFRLKYNAEIDPSCKDISRLCFVSYDHGAWYNSRAQPFPVGRWMPAVTTSHPKRGGDDDASTPWGDYDVRCDMSALMNEAGWSTDHHAQDGCTHYTRPGKTSGTSATLYPNRWLTVWTSSNPVLRPGNYTASQIYAHFHHAGDMHEAAKALAGLGYGQSQPSTAPTHQTGAVSSQSNSEDASPWQTAREMFPRVPVPWDYLAVSDSIKQLARAGAVTPTPLPGAVMAILAGVIGRSADISPKQGWREPLIIWHADIRESGDGKTHPARMLIQSMYAWQKEEDERCQREQQAYESLPLKERKCAVPPAPARSYFGTDITLEGIRTALDGHPTGGTIVLLDELSTFFSGQNQYKNGKGSDRESWLCLHDGNPARVIRAGKSCFIHGGRVQLYGGVQPSIFRQSLIAKNGLYMADGTVFRFLFTFSKSSFQELTNESWSHEHREQWASILSLAKSWADQHVDAPCHMILTEDARARFIDWRNEIYGIRESLPGELRGFLPKAIGYALRLTGIIHCLNRFTRGQEPLTLLDNDDLEAGIAFTRFYLGQTVDAIHYMIGKQQVMKADTSDTRVQTLGRVLSASKGEADHGRLGMSWLMARYNEAAQTPFENARGFGAFLRSVGLTVAPGTHDFRGQRRVKCLVLDKKTETLEKDVSTSPRLQSKAEQGFPDGDVENATSPCLHDSSSLWRRGEEAKTTSPCRNIDVACLGRHGDVETSFSGENKKISGDDLEVF